MADRPEDIFKALEEAETVKPFVIPERLEVTHEVFDHLASILPKPEREPVRSFLGFDIVVDESVPNPPGWKFVWPEGHEPDPVLVVRSPHLDLPEGKVGYRIGHDLLIMDAEGEALPPQDPTGRAFKEVSIGDPEVGERIRAILDEAIAKTDPWKYPPSMSMFSPEAWDRIMGSGRLSDDEFRRLYEGRWTGDESTPPSEERTPPRDAPGPRVEGGIAPPRYKERGE